jgi:hypothetical protein
MKEINDEKNLVCASVDPARSEKVVAVGWSGSFMLQPPLGLVSLGNQ